MVKTVENTNRHDRQRLCNEVIAPNSSYFYPYRILLKMTVFFSFNFFLSAFETQYLPKFLLYMIFFFFNLFVNFNC